MRFIFNAVKDSKIASCAHYVVPPANKATLAPEDLAFLQAKGAFEIESEDLLGELITLYFRHVHPLLPVIDPYAFFKQYEQQLRDGGPSPSSQLSLLLLQSMFLAASSVSFYFPPPFPFTISYYSILDTSLKAHTQNLTCFLI